MTLKIQCTESYVRPLSSSWSIYILLRSSTFKGYFWSTSMKIMRQFGINIYKQASRRVLNFEYLKASKARGYSEHIRCLILYATQANHTLKMTAPILKLLAILHWILRINTDSYIVGDGYFLLGTPERGVMWRSQFASLLVPLTSVFIMVPGDSTNFLKTLVFKVLLANTSRSGNYYMSLSTVSQDR